VWENLAGEDFFCVPQKGGGAFFESPPPNLGGEESVSPLPNKRGFFFLSRKGGGGFLSPTKDIKERYFCSLSSAKERGGFPSLYKGESVWARALFLIREAGAI